MLEVETAQTKISRKRISNWILYVKFCHAIITFERKSPILPAVWKGNAHFGCTKYINASCELCTLARCSKKTIIIIS